MNAQSQAQPDADLVDGLRRGDPAAYRTLMRTYERRLFAFALGFMKDEDEAMDVVQDTFLRVFKKVATFKGDAAFSTWLFRISRNLCIDRLRRKQRAKAGEYNEQVLHADPAPGMPRLHATDAGNNPVKENLNKELGGELAAAFERLSDNHREILTLREIEGASYAEIAEIIEVPIGTVMSRLYHARRNLQKQLHGYLDPARQGASR